MALEKVPGGWKVRTRDGTRNAAGKLVNRSSAIYDRKADALAEDRRRKDAAKVRRELRRGGGGRVLSLTAILSLWGDHVLAAKIARAPHVAEVKHVLERLFERKKWVSITDLRGDSVALWRAERGGRGTDKPLGMLKGVLRYARDVLRQPVDTTILTLAGRRGVRRRAQPPLLTDDQVAQLVARARERGGRDAGAIVEHLATYGCRPVDACRLRVRDFNAVTGMLTLRETKNGETITHPLLAAHVAAYRELVAGRRPDDALFVSPYGEAWTVAKSAGQLLDWYTANVSEHLLPRAQWGLYLLKDYAISRMDRAGVDDRTKALFTGHLTLSVFERYKATNQERAAAALATLVHPAGAATPVAGAPQVHPGEQKPPR